MPTPPDFLARLPRLDPPELARLGLAGGLQERLCAWQAAHPGREVERVSDNGCGFAAERQAGSGFGLLGMEERARELGGSLRIDSRQGEGTRVVASFPHDEVGEEER